MYSRVSLRYIPRSDTVMDAEIQFFSSNSKLFSIVVYSTSAVYEKFLQFTYYRYLAFSDFTLLPQGKSFFFFFHQVIPWCYKFLTRFQRSLTVNSDRFCQLIIYLQEEMESYSSYFTIFGDITDFQIILGFFLFYIHFKISPLCSIKISVFAQLIVLF